MHSCYNFLILLYKFSSCKICLPCAVAFIMHYYSFKKKTWFLIKLQVEHTIDLPQITDEVYYIKLYQVHLSSPTTKVNTCTCMIVKLS